MEGRTLQLKRPFGKTLVLSWLVLALLLGAAEILARTERFQSLLTAPAMGSRHFELGWKLALLEMLSNREAPIECIAIGSSMVDLGFDPQAFAAGFKGSTGQDIRCFNFGIDALPAAGSAALAGILVKDYRPGILIYGTDARDYSVAREAEDTVVVLDSAWVRYRTGHFSVEGWLLEHFYLYRYRDILSLLARFNFEDARRSGSRLNEQMTSYGFTPYSTVGTYVYDPPNPKDESFQINYYFRLLSDYEMREENLSGLEQIFNENGPSTRVIVVEMPVPAGYFYFFENGKDDYDRFIKQIASLAEGNVPFLQTTLLDPIPEDGWVDYSHLNRKGASVFSGWLGEKVGEIAKQSITNQVAP